MRDAKWCPRCETERPIGDFHPDAVRSDGLSGYCKTCTAAYSRINERRWRKAALAVLGDCCRHCGIADPRVLAIDHVEDDGAAARQKGLKQVKLYKHVVRHSRHYQLLCHNCNWLKRLDADRAARLDTQIELDVPSVRACIVCEEPFAPRYDNPGASYCSPRCRVRAHRARLVTDTVTET